MKKDYQQKADLEQGVKTLRVRFSLDSKVYVYHVTIATSDNKDNDFEENIFGSFTCSSRDSASSREGWLGSPTSSESD